jgi:hypothetical protein
MKGSPDGTQVVPFSKGRACPGGPDDTNVAGRDGKLRSVTGRPDRSREDPAGAPLIAGPPAGRLDHTRRA